MNVKITEDSPDIPRLFVDAVTAESIKVHWQLRTGGLKFSEYLSNRLTLNVASWAGIKP